MGKYDIKELEKAAARVRAKLGDFDEQWIDKHKDELNKGGFFFFFALDNE